MKIISHGLKEKMTLNGRYEKERMMQLKSLVDRKNVSVDEIISIYRSHPVMRALIEMMFDHGGGIILMYSEKTIEKAVGIWKEDEYNMELSTAIRHT